MAAFTFSEVADDYKSNVNYNLFTEEKDGEKVNVSVHHKMDDTITKNVSVAGKVSENGNVTLIDPETGEEKEDVDVNILVNIRDYMDGDGDRAFVSTEYLDQVIDTRKPKRRLDELDRHGVYIEKDLSDVLNKLSAKGGRGAKSRIVNEALRGIFRSRKLI